MRRFAYPYWMLGVMLLALSGCGPRIDQAELGQISKSLPVVPGTDQPYPLPELDVPSAVDAAAAAGNKPEETPEKPEKAAETAAPADQAP